MDIKRKIKKIAIYLRISQEKRGENIETLANHREELTEFCKEMGYEYVEYGEVVRAGESEIESREALVRLLNDIEKYDAILVMELSRISRNGVISQTVKQKCIDYDKPILTPFQTYDLANNENDRLMYDLGSMLAAHEHGVIGKRSKKNKIAMAKAGFHVTGAVPLGYVRNPQTKKLEIDKENAETIRYIFKLHSQGMGSYKIRDILNAEGYKPQRSKYFSLPSIKRIIKNPHYKGWTVFTDRKKVMKNGKRFYEVVDTIVVKNTHPAIVPEEEWDKANRDREERIIKAKNVRERPAIKTGITPLKDLIYCGECGRKLEVRLDEKSSTGYMIRTCDYLVNGDKCRNAGIRLEFVLNEFYKLIDAKREETIKQIGLLEEKGDDELKKEYERKLSRLKSKIKEFEEQDKELINYAVMKIFKPEQIVEKKNEIQNQIMFTKEEIEKVKLSIEELNVDDKIKMLKEIVDKMGKVPNAEPEDANELLKTFVKKVHYYRVVPEEMKHLHANSKERRSLPASIEVEFYE